jgi:adenylylsulfate kinase
MAGLPGTGKTTLARALAARLSGSVLSKDQIRHAVFSPEDVEYSEEQDDFCIEIMLNAAAFLFKRNSKRYVFLDGRPFSRSYQVDHVVQFAKSVDQPWRIVECICSEESAQRRLSSNAQLDHPAGNRTFDLYLEVKSRFEPITMPKVIIDTEQPLQAFIEQVLESLS